MIPVKQTIWTENDGNCIAACLASILENDINSYPHLPNNQEWYPILAEYLHTLGYNLILIDNPYPVALAGYHLICGINPTSNLVHCIVGKNGEPFFDPSPHRDQYSKQLQNPYYGIISKLFL